MKTKSSLNNFKLHYEETERKQVSKEITKVKSTSTAKHKPAVKSPAKATVTLKDRIDSIKKNAILLFNNIKKKLGFKSKKATKTTKDEKKLARKQKIRGIIGICLLFVVVSIAYSTYMTVLFVNGTIMVIALAPQVIFAVVTLLIAFYKIYK